METNCEISRRLTELGIELPPPCQAAGNYKPAIICEDLLYVSGHTPDDAFPEAYVTGQIGCGKVGDKVSMEEGYKAAQDVALAVLATVKHACGGDFRRVRRLLRATGVINCTPDFTDHPKIMNGFSDLMARVFGEVNGIGARSATGANSLPGDVPVEVTEVIFELRPAIWVEHG